MESHHVQPDNSTSEAKFLFDCDPRACGCVLGYKPVEFLITNEVLHPNSILNIEINWAKVEESTKRTEIQSRLITLMVSV